MKKITIFFFFFFFLLCASGQVNLVPNPGFENHTSLCDVGDITDTYPWQNPTGGSPNYFNSCTTLQPDYSVPQNMFGFQNAYSGSGYALFGTYLNNPFWPNFREYIQVKLLDSLKADKNYSVKFYISLADSSNYAVDKVGLYFSDIAISKSIYDYSPFNVIPQIENPAGNFISDKINWTEISGTYIAHGGEQYITIGNFYDNAHTDTIHLSDGSVTQLKESGFYIDDVSVTLINEDTLNSLTIPNAFTPNGDGVNDIFKVHGQNIKTLHGRIINRWGQSLYEWSDVNGGWNSKHNGMDVSAGTYFYVIQVVYNDGNTETKKGSVEVVR